MIKFDDNKMKVDDEYWNNYDNKKHEATVKWRLEKAGNNPIKKWFYLGKFDKKENKYGYDSYYETTLYDKILWKKFLKYAKTLEKKGLTLNRYYMETPITFKLYKDRSLKSSHWRKFCKKWWFEKIEYIFSFWKFNSRICMFDYFDIYQYLIINLTIKGMQFAKFGTSAIRKLQMHQCWLIRKGLIDSYCAYDDLAEYEANEITLSKFNSKYDLLNDDNSEKENFFWNTHRKIVKRNEKIDIKAFAEMGKYIKNLWD